MLIFRHLYIDIVFSCIVLLFSVANLHTYYVQFHLGQHKNSFITKSLMQSLERLVNVLHEYSATNTMYGPIHIQSSIGPEDLCRHTPPCLSVFMYVSMYAMQYANWHGAFYVLVKMRQCAFAQWLWMMTMGYLVPRCNCNA